MGWFSDDYQNNYDGFQDTHHASVTHELLSGAVAYEAAKAYENHCEENGRPVDHGTAKALLAGFAGAATDRLVETKGLDYWDDYKRNQVCEQAQQTLSENVQYSRQYSYSESDQYQY